MQTIEKEKAVSLNLPTYTIEKPKPIAKKKLTFWQKLLKIFGL